MLNLQSVMPPITPGSLSSSAALTCPKPRSGHGSGLAEGEADPDADGELAGVAVAGAVAVGVGRTVWAAVGDAVTVALPHPAAKTAAKPMPIRAEA